MTYPNPEHYQPQMEPNAPNELNLKRTIFISMGFFSVLIALTYYNFSVPLLLETMIASDILLLGLFGQKTVIGSIMTIDNLLALLLQPWFASLSDRTKSRFGRRIPYVIIGVLSCAFFFSIAPWIRFLAGFLVIIFLFNIFMSFYRSAALTLLADYTPEQVRSKGSGIHQLVSNIGTLVAFGIPYIIGFVVPNLAKVEKRSIGFVIIGIIMVLSLIVLLRTIKETPTGNKFLELADKPIKINSVTLEIVDNDRKDTNNNGPDMLNGLNTIFVRSDRSIVWLLTTVFCVYTGFASIEAFFSLFATKYLLLDDGTAALLGLVYPSAMIASALPAGYLGQNLGRKRYTLLCIGSLVALMVFQSFIAVPAKNILLIGIVLALSGFFFMGCVVNFFPMVWALAPEGDEGAFTGIYYFFNQAAYVFSPILIGLVFDIFGQGMPIASDQYLFMFPYIGFCMILGFIFMYFVEGVESQSINDTP